ncbi:histidine kinase dimerization/phospho-acceptor domain-containing protein [Streptomyces sp. NPDC058579]|uniref:histidine kinase dimerization/phospho-acceptor domain-containing protein n=1 Tax=Streptomyces sp. NPDC058579 TaxID=3346548 RepID=UPI00365608FD
MDNRQATEPRARHDGEGPPHLTAEPARADRTGGPRSELKELADTFDELPARLDAAFDSQRRFTANASHELRTPLAGQRAALQIGLENPTPRGARGCTGPVAQREPAQRAAPGRTTDARPRRAGHRAP